MNAKVGEMPYAGPLGLVPTKNPSLLKQHGHIQENQRAMNLKTWMIQCCLWGERKVSIFHTPSREPRPFQPKRKNGDMRIRGDPN